METLVHSLISRRHSLCLTYCKSGSFIFIASQAVIDYRVCAFTNLNMKYMMLVCLLVVVILCPPFDVRCSKGYIFGVPSSMDELIHLSFSEILDCFDIFTHALWFLSFWPVLGSRVSDGFSKAYNLVGTLRWIMELYRRKLQGYTSFIKFIFEQIIAGAKLYQWNFWSVHQYLVDWFCIIVDLEILLLTK